VLRYAAGAVTRPVSGQRPVLEIVYVGDGGCLTASPTLWFLSRPTTDIRRLFTVLRRPLAVTIPSGGLCRQHAAEQFL
jgi:hypothetical protein